jgi:hypothetical protein
VEEDAEAWVVPLSQLNQLMILANFATLQLKGVSRIQASIEIVRQWHAGEAIVFEILHVYIFSVFGMQIRMSAVIVPKLGFYALADWLRYA